MKLNQLFVFASVLLWGVSLAGEEKMTICRYMSKACNARSGVECQDYELNKCSKVEDVVDTAGVDMLFILECKGTKPIVKVYSNTTQCNGDALAMIDANVCVESQNLQDSYNFQCKEESCFSSSSLINLKDGSTKRASNVVEGDFVESFDIDGRPTFSEVFLVQHKNDNQKHKLRHVEYASVDGTSTGAILISDLHLIRKTMKDDSFIAAKDLNVGSSLFVLVPGNPEPIEARATRIESMFASVRNIHTMNDRIVVDGVMASSFTEIAPYSLTRLAVLPMKVLYRLGFTKLVGRIDEIIHYVDKSLFYSCRRLHIL